MPFVFFGSGFLGRWLFEAVALATRTFYPRRALLSLIATKFQCRMAPLFSRVRGESIVWKWFSALRVGLRWF